MDVGKKLELNPLRFDRDIKVLSQKKYIFKKFHLFAQQTKNALNQRIFKIFQKRFSTWSVITPLLFMGFNIDTRGHKKAQKRQIIAVGPEDPPPGEIPGSKTPGDKGLIIIQELS